MRGRLLALLLALGTIAAGCDRSLPVYHPAPDLTTPEPSPDLLVPAPPDLIPPADLAFPCSAQSASTLQNALLSSPLDLIVVVDNASTMTDSIVAIQQTIHNNLTRLLSDSGIDYRVILISRYGDAAGQGICVGPPLGGRPCAPPIKGPPANAPPRFFHYDLALDGPDALRRLLDSYRAPDAWNLAPSGWSGWLRRSAVKHFVVVSDDDTDMSANDFAMRLSAVDAQMFGGMKPSFVFHAIVGLQFNQPPAKPWGPQDPTQARTCGVVQSSGANYQDLAILTGGLRFPVCGDFGGAFFKELAKVLFDSTRLPPALPCEVEIPKPPQGMMFSSVALNFMPSIPPMAPPLKLQPVAGLAACMPSSFYLTPKSFVLCPDTCAALRKDPMGKLQMIFCWNPL